MAKELQYTKVLSEDSSFQLVRTNPKLTGNVKLTTNGTGDLWLNAIPANLELAKDDYSKFPIDVSHSLAANIKQFFKGGLTPNEIIFDSTETVDLTKTSKDYKDQFDFSHYFSGAKYFASNKYDERFSYLAPLYLKKEIPKYFVVLKIKDPMNYPIDEFKTKFEAGYETDEYLIDLFKNASIIKTFDLSINSTIGKYIRDYKNADSFPISPLSVGYDENDYTTWNGILIEHGIVGSKGELLYDQFRESTPLKAFEENITKGYERNGVIFPNILNLEFLFNDDVSEDYEMNRYLGLYVNTIELTKLEVDLDRAYAEKGIWPNNEPLKRPYYEHEETTLKQTNSTGVIFPYKNLDIYMEEFREIFTNSETLYFNYLTDSEGGLHLPKLNDPYNIDQLAVSIPVTLSSSGTTITATTPTDLADKSLITIDSISGYSGVYVITRINETTFQYTVPVAPSTLTAIGEVVYETGTGKITLSDTVINLADMFGPEQLPYLQDEGFGTTAKGYSYGVIKIKDTLAHTDEIRIYHPRGTRTDTTGKYDLLTAAIGYAEVPTSGDSYIFNDLDGTNGNDVFYFNPTGYLNESANAIATCLNGIRNRTFTAYAFNEYVFVKCNANGEFDNLHALSFTSPTAVYTSVDLDGIEDTELINNIVYFKGGSKLVGNRLVLDKKHLTKITDQFSNILIKTRTGWSRINKVANYVDLVNETNLAKTSTVTSAIQAYNEKIVVTLVEDSAPSIRHTEFQIHKKFRPSFGLLSLFPIKDLDMGFYTSQYLNFPEIDFYKDYYVPEGVTLLQVGKTYKVYGTGSVDVPEVDETLTFPLITPGTTSVPADTTFQVLTTSQFTIESGKPLISFDDSISTTGDDLTNPISDANRELYDFQGFSILKDPDKVTEVSTDSEFILKNKFINGLSTTEYDFYKENESTDFALRSKILPYITKWAIKDGKDARSNPYRLNTEIVFGRNNFSPDHTDLSQNPDNFTHEWFYIESNFNYSDALEAMQKNDYYFDKPFDESELLSDPDYFLNYFTYTPQFGTNVHGDPIDVAPTQFRYSRVFRNRAGQYEAFFKGFKLLFKDVNSSNDIGEDGKPIARNNTRRFADYKFSCILKPIKENWSDKTQQPVKYRVIEHKDHKFIVLVIEIVIGDLSQIADHWETFPDQTIVTENVTKVTNDISAIQPDVFITNPTFPNLFSPVLPYETIYGDYRFDFNTINGLDISNLNHTFIYALKNKKYNALLDNFSNVKMSSKLNIYTTLASNTIEKVNSPHIPNYPSYLTDEILKPNAKKPIGYTNLTTLTTYLIDSISLFIPTSQSPITQSFDNYVSYSLPPLIGLGTIVPIGIAPYVGYVQSLPLPGVFEQAVKDQYQFFVLLGGEQYYEKLFSKVSFGRFKQYVNSLDPIVEYESYELDQNGITVSVVDPKYYIEIPDQEEINKVSQIITLSDEDKPSQYSGNRVIGYVYEQAELNNDLDLNRYKGEFEPVVKDILHNRSKYYFNMNDIEDIVLGNTRLNTNISNIMTISNFNHIKVADSKILTLESDDAYTPQYPKIDEIAIGQADYFLLGSNWDWGFHHKYTTRKDFHPAPGTKRVEEDANFLSKLVILPSEIELEQFDLTTLTASQTLEDIELDEIEIVAKEETDYVSGYINLNNIITSYFITNGIEAKFNEYLINDTEYLGTYESIQEYVIDYIKLNLLKLYEVEEVEFYEKRNAEITSTEENANPNTISFEFLNDAERSEFGYSRIKTIGINKTDRLILKYKIQKNSGAGVNISPKVKIKFI